MTMFRSRRALKLFYSYAHEDEKLRDKLETALALLKRQFTSFRRLRRLELAIRHDKRTKTSHLNSAAN